MKRKLTREFIIDGSPMLTPDSVNVEFEDIESAGGGYDMAGHYHYSVMRHEQKTWTFTYDWLTKEEYTYVRSLLKGKGMFSFEYKDEDGTTQTVEAFSTRKSVAYWSVRRGVYKDLKFAITES